MSKITVFSMIVPAKNEEDSIEKCINSFLYQRILNSHLEVILADNGSTDRTIDKASRLGARILNLPDANIACLRNRGAEIALGDFLLFIDADIELPDSYLAYYLHLRTKGCDVLGLNTVLNKDNSNIFSVWENRNFKSYPQIVDYLPSTNFIIEKSIYHKVKGFDESLQTGEDKDIIQRIHNMGFSCIQSGEITAIHWGADHSFTQFIRKEFWRQKSAIIVARKNGLSLRLLRFPIASIFFFIFLIFSIFLLAYTPFILLIYLLLSLAFTALVAIIKWNKTEFYEVAIISILSLIRFWVAGVATILNLRCFKWVGQIATFTRRDRL